MDLRFLGSELPGWCKAGAALLENLKSLGTGGSLSPLLGIMSKKKAEAAAVSPWSLQPGSVLRRNLAPCCC